MMVTVYKLHNLDGFSWMNSKINIEYAILILVKGQRFSETLELLDL